MAANSTLYRIRVDLSDVDRPLYERLDLRLAHHPSETVQRLVARAIAYCLCYTPELEFTRGICEGDTPDIRLPGNHARMALWVEVGQASAGRMELASRKAERVRLFPYGERLRGWEQTHREPISRPPNVTLTPLPRELIEGLARGLQRNNQWALTLCDGAGYLDRGEANYPFEY
ncbi:MAG: YaeQ family protein [Candidatus Sedimenticola endophacoides]